MIEAGDGSVLLNSWTHSKKVLCSDADGRVFTSDNKLGEWEKWCPEKGKQGVVLRSVAHGRLLCMENGKFSTTLRSPDESCCWTFEPANRNIFRLQSGQRHLLAPCKGSNNEGIRTITKQNKQSEWKVEFVDDEFVTLKHQQSNTFLAAEGTGTLTSSIGPQMWTLEPAHHGIQLRSLYDEVLCCDAEGKVYLSSDDECTWALLPCLPLSPTGRQIWTMAGAGLAGVALVAVAPFAVAGMMGALGAAEVAAGGVAAAVSAEAVVGAAAGGALLGGAVVGTTGALVLRKKDKTELETKDEDSLQECRPFAAWEYWQ